LGYGEKSGEIWAGDGHNIYGVGKLPVRDAALWCFLHEQADAIAEAVEVLETLAEQRDHEFDCYRNGYAMLAAKALARLNGEAP
jgi:hypothetical protein